MGISFHETTIYSIDFNRSMPHWGLSKNGCAPFSCASDMAPVSSLCCLKICSTWPNHNFAGENSGENWKIHPKNPQLSSVVYVNFLENEKVRNGAFLKGRRRRCRSKCLARQGGICLFTFPYAESSKTTSASLPFWGLLTFLLKVVRMGINSNRYWWIKQQQFGFLLKVFTPATVGTVVRITNNHLHQGPVAVSCRHLRCSSLERPFRPKLWCVNNHASLAGNNLNQTKVYGWENHRLGNFPGCHVCQRVLIPWPDFYSKNHAHYTLNDGWVSAFSMIFMKKCPCFFPTFFGTWMRQKKPRRSWGCHWRTRHDDLTWVGVGSCGSSQFLW